MQLPWTDPRDGAASSFIRKTGWLIMVVNVVVALTLVVRAVDFNVFLVIIVGCGLGSGYVAARTGRALLPFVLLLLAAYPTIFGWYVFFYLPLLILLALRGAARSLMRTRGADPERSG